MRATDDAPQRTELAAAWRDATEAGLRYYTRLGGLAFELVEALVPVIGELRPTVRLSPDPPSAPARTPPAQSGDGSEHTIVIEATAGRSGLGVFMIENTTVRKVSAPIGVSAFVDASGREVHPEVRFSPAEVTLEPGDQVLVQVAAAVDETLEPDVRYQAEITVPSLSGTGIPIVVRRRPGLSRAGSARGTAARARAKAPRAAKRSATPRRS
jgi:hypothetical protein